MVSVAFYMPQLLKIVDINYFSHTLLHFTLCICAVYTSHIPDTVLLRSVYFVLIKPFSQPLCLLWKHLHYDLSFGVIYMHNIGYCTMNKVYGIVGMTHGFKHLRDV